MAGSLSDEVGYRSKEFQEFRQKMGPEKVDAFIEKYHFLDRGKFVSHAAPTIVLLQFATQERNLKPEIAKQHAAVASEPKIFKLYEAPHALDALARRDRIRFLVEQLKLKPVSDASISAIPDLYQPPAQN